MEFIGCEKEQGQAVLTLKRGKVNALNLDMVLELSERLKDMENDPEIRSVVVTGSGKFFSFGFDVPEFLPLSKAEFTEFLEAFTSLYAQMFLFSKPLVAALNGHTIAGGCMLALAADYRVMVEGRARIALNELGFGAAVFAGSLEMLRFHSGSAKAARILYSADLLSASDAKTLGLVDEAVGEADLKVRSGQAASELGAKPGAAFAAIKSLLRKPVAEEFLSREKETIREFVEIWYSEETRKFLKDITIR